MAFLFADEQIPQKKISAGLKSIDYKLFPGKRVPYFRTRENLSLLSGVAAIPIKKQTVFSRDFSGRQCHV